VIEENIGKINILANRLQDLCEGDVAGDEHGIIALTAIAREFLDEILVLRRPRQHAGELIGLTSLSLDQVEDASVVLGDGRSDHGGEDDEGALEVHG